MSIRPAVWLVALASTSLAAGTAYGEPRARRVEVGGFVGLDYFGDDIELGNSWASEQVPGTSLMLGGRGTFIVLPDLLKSSSLDPQLGVEGEAKLAFASTGESSEGGRGSSFSPVFGWRAHAILRLRWDHVLEPHLVVGGGGESVVSSSPFLEADTDAAFYWGPGVSWRLSDRLDARVDLRHGLTAGRDETVTSTLELQFGLTTGWDVGHAQAAPARRDRDGDGFLDGEDACPDEPETENDFKDDDGCPDTADTDGDGILDPDDACPDKAETKNGIDDQDGCPEEDPDGDGLVGSQDACPTDAEDVDGFEDQDGCPDPDNDRDTILDPVDRCPMDPEVYNGFTDDDGCPDELPKVIKEFTGSIDGITFEYGKARIVPRSKDKLNRAAATLREYASIRIRIEGHTDDRGPREKNMALSQKRADTVRWYLVDQGIAADRIETVGHGPDLPLTSNKTAKGRAANRRIEFHIVFQDPTLNAQTQPTPAPAPAPAPTPAP